MHYISSVVKNEIKITENNTNLKPLQEKMEKAKTLNYKKFFGIGSNAIYQDIGVNRYYIIQGFNKIVTKRQNEVRVFFHNGVAKYTATSSRLASYPINLTFGNTLLTFTGPNVEIFTGVTIRT